MTDRTAGAVRRRRIVIAVAVVVGGIVALNLLAQGLDRAVGGNEPGGVADSSYATAPDGLAAYAALLARFDHDVVRQRGRIRDLSPRTTVFVISPQTLVEDERAALVEFVTSGGRLVIGGASPFYVGGLRNHPPEWQPAGYQLWRDIDPAFTPARLVETAAQGSWRRPGSGRPVVSRGSDALVTTERVGDGQMIFLADPSPIENAYLARADNAAFGLSLAGPPERPVAFAEGVHGFGASRGWRAIPTDWKLALALIGIAILALVWSRARRFGPPDKPARDLPPARAEYVRALSLTLERTRDRPGALSSLQRWTRDRVAVRAGLPADTDDEAVARAAADLGCAPDEVRALLAPPRDDQDVLALGRALAHVTGNDGRTE